MTSRGGGSTPPIGWQAGSAVHDGKAEVAVELPSTRKEEGNLDRAVGPERTQREQLREPRMSYKPIAPAPTGSSHTPPGSGVSSLSPSLPSSSTYRPVFSDFGPPSMGFVQPWSVSQPVKVSQGSTYSELLSVIEEMSREIRPTYAGSKSAMERLKRGIIHARALVRECLAETERNARS
ncbi:cyclin-dependent kinase 2-associated protein 2-like [Scleropages formosus]|uniref:Cyclin-dependent kinase 2-associated protein 2-like n=1 Tax=Scleropages formosus TaxID=113540 RepID=A0A0P7UVC7_SCLFO|nr:cyclin-dependent kinase 2-associated protein 2-like [Scleropages formosus]